MYERTYLEILPVKFPLNYITYLSKMSICMCLWGKVFVNCYHVLKTSHYHVVSPFIIAYLHNIMPFTAFTEAT